MISKVDALISLCPDAKWTWIGLDYSGLDWQDQVQPKPTEQEIDAEQAKLIADEPLTACKAQASLLLSETDWTTIPDVANPSDSNPYLINQREFMTWRSEIRKYAVNPVANPVWPTQPTPEWGNK